MVFTPIVKFIQARHFKFRPVYSFVMVLGICICSIAAFWQYEKALFYTQPKAQILHIHGSYFNEHSRYLDNQTHNGQVGYAVITPFLYDGTVYMVNRGFIAYKNRSEMPKIEPVLGDAVLKGRLHVNHKPLLLNTTLIDPISERVQFVDRQAFITLLNLPVKNEVFILNEGKGLLTKANEKEPYLNHHKHQAYALQWFLLAVFGLAIWLVASLIKPEEQDAPA